jgi:ribonuclease P protein component
VPNVLFPFSKQQRLLNSAEFKQVIISPIAQIADNVFTIRVAYLQNSESEKGKFSQLGITIPKRYVRKAVQRNTIKRIVRESFRLNHSNVPALAIVVMLRRTLLELNKKEIRTKIDNLWLQLQKKFPSVSVNCS